MGPTETHIDRALAASNVLSGLSLPLFAFYMMVACNFTGDILGCRLRTLLSGDMLAKHAMGYVLLLFLVVAVTPENADKDFLRNAALSAAVYAWFVVTTRCPMLFTLGVLLLLLATYVLGATKRRSEAAGDAAATHRVAIVQATLCASSVALSLAGFAVYYAKKRARYGRAFRMRTFLIGVKRCKNRD
jgi:hypothetical protein